MIYTFKCEHCNKAFEVEQKMEDKHTADCPHCKEPAIRVYSLGINLNGLGFGTTSFNGDC